MRRPRAIKSLTAAALLSPLAATCTPPATMMAEAHQQALQSVEDRLVAFLIDGDQAPR
jgi:hypothetical protein